MKCLYKTLLFIVLNINYLSNQLENEYCQSSIINDASWQDSERNDNFIVSEPLCLDRMKMIVTRNCTNTGWMPIDDEIECQSTQNEFKMDTYCPSGYIEIYNTKICILILKNHIWGTDCVQHGSTIDMRQLIRTKSKIGEFLKVWGIDKFWLPAKRDNNIDYIKWKLPPPLWNKPIEYDNDKIPIDNNGDCLSMNLTLHESLENCESHLPLICLFDKNTETIVMKSFCNRAGSISARLDNYRDTCFTIQHAPESEEINLLALIDTTDKYFVVQSVIQYFHLENSPVLIDLVPGAKGYFNIEDWRHSIDYLDFIDWDHRFDTLQIYNTSLDLYTVLWNEKWNLVDENLLEYQIIADKFDLSDFPAITISYNSTYDGLDVYIANEIRLWKPDIGAMLTCFSNGNALEPILKFDKIERLTNVWKFPLPYYKGNARYWCEGVTVNDFQVVKSNLLEIQRNLYSNELIYSILIEVPCTVCNFYSELNKIQYFVNMMSHAVRETDDFEEVKWQIKKIVEFTMKTATLHFHFIVKNIHGYSKSEARNVIRYLVNNILDEMTTDARLIFVRDMDTCFSQNPDFPDTLIGHPSVYTKPCVLKDSLPPIQHCAGDLIEGAYWINTYNESTLDCIDTDANSDLSFLDTINKELNRLNSLNITAMLAQIEDRLNEELNYTATSLHYMTEMLQNIVQSPFFESTPNETFLENPINAVSDIIDTVINTNQSVLQKAQSEMNTTNIMLDTIDKMAQKYSMSKSFDSDLEADGTILIVKRNLIVMISNPLIKHITGIAIYKKTPYYADNNFDNYSIRKLYGNETYENIYNDTLEIGVNIPFRTLQQINISRNGESIAVERLIFKIFFKDSFFQEANTNGTTEILKANSKIIGITIPEYHEDHLPPGVFLVVKKDERKINATGYGCSDWTMDSTRTGWNKNFQRSEMLKNYGILCYITRLRNYGFVQLLGNDVVINEDANDDRDFIFIISIIGCLLSLFGIFVIFLTAFLIKVWRQREATPLILNICTATGLQLSCYLLSETHIFHHHAQCIIIGATLHYVTIVGFFLSLFVANLQYRRYIIIFGPSTPIFYKTRLIVFGWIVPLLIVFTCMYVDPAAYQLSEEYLNLGGICYPSGNVLLYAVHIPVVFIFCINLCVYVWIIIHLNMERPNLRKSPTRSNISKQFFLFAYMFCLMSLTWIFGMLAHFLYLKVFSYLFVITGTLQGFIIFLFCVIFDSSIRKIFSGIRSPTQFIYQ